MTIATYFLKMIQNRWRWRSGSVEGASYRPGREWRSEDGEDEEGVQLTEWTDLLHWL